MIATFVLLIESERRLIKLLAYRVGIVGFDPEIDTLKKRLNESRFSKAPMGSLILVIVEGEASVLSAVTLIKFLERLPDSLLKL